jgi:glucuronokinase
MIKKTVYPRVGFLGNPSDGFFGKTISFPFRNFQAEVILWQSKSLKFIPNAEDQDEFLDISDLHNTTKTQGYYGGIRLLKAAASVFYGYCKKTKIKLVKKNFSIVYRSNIPMQRGLAGSSAIVIGTLKALIDFFELPENIILPAILASIALLAEVNELGISAGLQDRVVQSYNRPVFMDFSKEAFAKNKGLFGQYETFSPSLLPPIGLVWNESMSESGKVHSDIRNRFEGGDEEVIRAMAKFAQIAERGMNALREKNFEEVFNLVNANFDLRRELYGDRVVGFENIKMIESARNLGAAAKFPGSGGAALIVAKEEKLDKVIESLRKLGYKSERVIL